MYNNPFFYFASDCKTSGLLGFPYWYKYISRPPACQPQLTGLNDIWLIVAAIVEILLRIAAIAAVAYIIYGGAMYITSQGEPDKAQAARKTLIGALTGLIISVLATVIISFIAGSIQ